MKLLLLLGLSLAAASAAPQFFGRPPQSSATGSASSGSVFGSAPGSTISQTFAQAQGSTSGSGTSVNQGSASQSSTSGIFGNSQTGNSQASSFQNTQQSGFGGFRPFGNQRRPGRRPNKRRPIFG